MPREAPSFLPPTPVLETARLVLRPLRMADAPEIQRRFARWEVVRWLAAVVPWPYPDDGAAQHAARCVDDMARGAKRHWAITLRGEDTLIGCIDLWPDDGESRDMRGFWLDPAVEGRGLMTEAAERVTEYAFLTLDWPCLWLSNAEANTASGRIKEKQGAELVEIARGDFVSGPGPRMVWRLDRDAWLARRGSA